MKLLLRPLAALILFGSPVHAADSVSFVIAGHRVHVESRPHCDSASCLSVSIPGIYERRGRDRHDEDRNATAAAPTSVTASARKPAPSAVCAPPATVQSIASVAQPVVAAPRPQPLIQPPQIQPAPATATTPLPALLPPPPAPRISTVAHEVDEEPADSPLGDWQTQGDKGMVRIEPCGQALCGYVLDPSSNAKGETVLVDMKSKSASEWSGNIYSRGSGNTYYGTIAMKGPNSLKVEACALGRFFCSGNVWTRADISRRA